MPVAVGDVVQRVAHRHYYLNALLCTPLPAIVALHLRRLALAQGGLERNSVLVLVAAPAFFALSVLNRRWDSIEALLESVFWLLQLFNAVGLVLTRSTLPIPAWYCPAYCIVWFLVSLVVPQPPYLGPHAVLPLLSPEAFEEEIEMAVPSSTIDDPDAPTTLVELKDYEGLRNSSRVYHVVLFHADWSRKSRQLEITLSWLSSSYASETLKFWVITPDDAPQTFYDLDLSTHTTAFDLPVLMLYHRGRVIGRLPKGRKELGRNAGNKKKAKGDESEGEESEDERELEHKVAMERYRWTRSADSIVDAFKLRERSARFVSDKRTS